MLALEHRGMSHFGGMRAPRENENVSGVGDDCGVSSLHLIGTDTPPAVAPWSLSEAPTATVGTQAPLW